MFKINIFNSVFLCFILSILILIGCNEKSYIEPIISLDSYKVTDGFTLKAVASEPLLEAPVAMDFDNQSRMWVIEMRGYMMNLEGTGEDTPNGRIVILEDLDKDGVSDHAKVFLDSLILPRAILHVYGGLLYVEPPNLWFVEVNNDMPGKKTLVDPIYADAGNVEHQPNGLMLNIDNWIYNANSNFRYQRKNGAWIKEPTSYRGQWGISKDNFGRLFYNSNSTLLKGDYVLPNTTIKNEYFSPEYSLDQILTEGNRVYPLHATAVNRGYNPGVLDDEGKLIDATSACGPLIYRGGQFPNDYNQNAFVCVPEANLIKRIQLQFEDNTITGKAAWRDKEFIASTDESFRPVNLFNGPDGSIYVVDMHRGVIQHKAFISQYLTKLLGDKRLDTVVGMGRILKIEKQNQSVTSLPNFNNASSKNLVAMLSNSNGWIRDKAQHNLILGQDQSLIPDLKILVKNKNTFNSQIHALYVLDELNGLSYEYLSSILLLDNIDVKTKAHALVLLQNYTSEPKITQTVTLIEALLKINDPIIDMYISTTMESWIKLSKESFAPFLIQIGLRYKDQPIFQESIISSVSGIEDYLLDIASTNDLLKENLRLVILNQKNEDKNSIFINTTVKEDNRTNGLKLFRSICAACHGPAGYGIQDLAPPLKESEYVNGPIKRLALIILHGMQGPIHVNNKLYNFNLAMPGMVNNESLSDQDIVDIINFLQNAFVHDRKRINAADINLLREVKPLNGNLFTEQELLDIEL